MSRSLRHTPIIPTLNVESEKKEKTLAHQRERKWVNDHLKPVVAIDDDFDLVAYHDHPKSGRAQFRKDGKEFIGSRAIYEDPRSLRK